MLKALNVENSMMTERVTDWMVANGTGTAVVWAPYWSQLEPDAPGQQDESQLTAFDNAVALAHDADLKTYVAVGSDAPAWATRLQREKRPTPRGGNWRLPPDNTSPVSPWADFLRLVVDRHPNVQGVIVVNEPNAGFVDYRGSTAFVTAQMMLAAADVWREMGATPMLLGPATWSGPGALIFTEQVLGSLSRTPKWADGINVGWAHHSYADITAGHVIETRGVLDLLRLHHHWGGDDQVWLTEGGYRYATVHKPGWDYYADPAFWSYHEPLADQERLQTEHVARHLSWCRKTGRVAMWANYEWEDAMWGGWASGLIRSDGLPHPIAERWRHL